MSFEKIGLSENTIKAIRELGMEKPTTVQYDVIPSILEGKDVFTIAPARCGKTASYVLPLIEIISKHEKQNILIITPSPKHSIAVSDNFAIFNKYHEINETTIADLEEDIDNEANVIIGSPDLIIELLEDNKIDLSNINILVVDDINLIKSYKQLDNFEKILEVLPNEKQNIVYTNRRSKETQDILDKILKTPEEIKVSREAEKEADVAAQNTKLEEISEVSTETKTDTSSEEQPIKKITNRRDIKDTRDLKRQQKAQERKEKNRNNKNSEKENKSEDESEKENKINNNEAKNNRKEIDAPVKKETSNNQDKETIIHTANDIIDKEAERLAAKNKSYADKTPKFILTRGIVVRD